MDGGANQRRRSPTGKAGKGPNPGIGGVCVCVCAETFLACRFIKCQTAMVLANQDV